MNHWMKWISILMLRQFEVNALGPLRMSPMQFLPALRGGGKIALITSRMGSIADNGSGGALWLSDVEGGVEYGRRLAGQRPGIARYRGCHIASGLRQDRYDRASQALSKPGEAVGGLLRRIEQLTLENSGGFWHSNGESLPW